MIFNKFFYFAVLMGMTPIVAQVTVQNTVNPFGVAFLIILMVIVLLPQLLLVFKSYRKELLCGIQDADGKTNREDLKYFASIAMPLMALQALIILHLFNSIQGGETPQTVTWSLVAVATGTAITKLLPIKGNK